jgi:hypothetical protein
MDVGGVVTSVTRKFDLAVSMKLKESVQMASVSIHKASDLRPEVKSAVEQLLGRAIEGDEEVSVIATPPQQIAPSADRATIARKLRNFLDGRADKVRGMSDEEMDSAVDEAVERARHTRE